MSTRNKGMRGRRGALVTDKPVDVVRTIVGNAEKQREADERAALIAEQEEAMRVAREQEEERIKKAADERTATEEARRRAFRDAVTRDTAGLSSAFSRATVTLGNAAEQITNSMRIAAATIGPRGENGLILGQNGLVGPDFSINENGITFSGRASLSGPSLSQIPRQRMFADPADDELRALGDAIDAERTGIRWGGSDTRIAQGYHRCTHGRTRVDLETDADSDTHNTYRVSVTHEMRRDSFINPLAIVADRLIEQVARHHPVVTSIRVHEGISQLGTYQNVMNNTTEYYYQMPKTNVIISGVGSADKLVREAASASMHALQSIAENTITATYPDMRIIHAMELAVGVAARWLMFGTSGSGLTITAILLSENALAIDRTLMIREGEGHEGVIGAFALRLQAIANRD